MKRSVKRKVNLALAHCKFGICVKDLALCHLSSASNHNTAPLRSLMEARMVNI